MGDSMLAEFSARGLATAASKAGARMFIDSQVQAIEPLSGGVRLVTNRGEVTAERVIVATGAYYSKLIPGRDRGFVPLGYFIFATEALTANLREIVLPGRVAIWDTSPSMLAATKENGTLAAIARAIILRAMWGFVAKPTVSGTCAAFRRAGSSVHSFGK